MRSEGDEQGPRTDEGGERGAEVSRIECFQRSASTNVSLSKGESTEPAAAVGRGDANHPSLCPWPTWPRTTGRAEEGMDVELTIDRDRRAHLILPSPHGLASL